MSHAVREREPVGILKRLQEWYLGECNGDWEHTFGVKIETLDNPGWLVTIDLAETAWESLEVRRTIVEAGPSDWYQWEVSQRKFIGCGGGNNLSDVLLVFLNLVEREGVG